MFKKEIIVGDHTSNRFKANRGACIPGPAFALEEVEHLPDPSRGHLRGAPAVKVFPVYLLHDFHIICTKTILVKVPK